MADPINTSVAPRPTLPQAGSASSGLYTQDDVLQKLNDQLSLSEGLQQQRMSYATGTGAKVRDALANPANRAYGESPNAGLPYATSLQESMQKGIREAGNNTMDVLTAINSIFKQRKDAELQAKQYKLDEIKLKADLASKNIVIDETTGEPRGMTEQELQSTGKTYKTGPEAVSEVLKQGGADVLNQAKDVNARTALAEEILKTGGVKEYRKQLPLDSLLNDSERTEVQKNASLLSQIDQAIPVFSSGDKVGGTGPIAGLVPGFISPEKTREMRRQVGAITTQFQQLISGKVISDKEVKRLSAFLPNQYKSESENLGDLVKLKTEIEKNMSLFEKAKQEGLTANQAYEKYGKESSQGKGGTIRVKRKSDGKVGTMTESNFNSDLYERI